jgi:signal transduction histidine kinase
MRSYAHKLENMESPITLTEVLMLRRHEKDFLLRKEDRYIREYNALVDTLIAKARATHHEASRMVLENYRDLFNRLTRLDYEIGITPTEGLLGKLNRETALISRVLRELTRLSEERIEKDVNKSTILLSAISLITIVASTLLTYYTSTRMARPIKKLSLSMGKFIVNEGLNETDLQSALDTNEISNLSQAFIKLSRKLKNQFGEIQQQNRELKKLNEELDRFIYSAAHDLKSPLASMDGLIRLAEREINSPGHAHYFQMMSSSVHKLDGFIRDITDYAKNKRQHLKIEKIDLERLVLDILDSVRFLPHADLMRAQVSVTGLEFYTDRARLEIVLKNLISNSYRYMDFSKQEPYIKIEGVVGEKELRINVIDNGIGIGKSHLPRIFDMFYRAVEHSQGTGIGLFLVKESVKMLRGRISVKSNLGEWTLFHLVLPNLKDGNLNVPESEVYMLEEPRELQA